MDQSQRTLDDQIATIERLSHQHYPQDEAARCAFVVEKLKERLREFHYRLTELTVREMR